MHKEEKKVEFLELIYDLIFVYLIGRNNQLLHHTENGFFTAGTYLTFAICTLAVIQIWNFSTFYINRYGRNRIRDHIFLFINMYLLYFMAEGTRTDWQDYFLRYNVSWALILINIGVQNLIEMRNHRLIPWELKQLKRTALVILSEAAIVGISIPVYYLWGVTIAPAAIVFGIVLTTLSGHVNGLVSVDFAHLSERAMLYVVFTFGEMIIAIASYFEGTINLNTIFFSCMAFLIVAGLFLGYETVYNHIIDRERQVLGTGYMMIHVFLIFALNNITTALEYMREEEVNLLPKTIFLAGSMALYFFCLFLTDLYAKEGFRFDGRFRLALAGMAAGFVALMIICRGWMFVSVTITVLYVFGIYVMMYFYGCRRKRSL